MSKATEIQALRRSIGNLETLALQLADDARHEDDRLKRLALEQSALRRWREIRTLRSKLRQTLIDSRN